MHCPLATTLAHWAGCQICCGVAAAIAAAAAATSTQLNDTAPRMACACSFAFVTLQLPAQLLPLLTCTSGDRDRLRACSFAIVIQQLPPQLRDAVCVFYLVLRALDTVEDDMAVPQEIKIPLLRAFHEKCYDRCGALACLLHSNSPCLPRKVLCRVRRPSHASFASSSCCAPATRSATPVRRPSLGCDLCAARQQVVVNDGSKCARLFMSIRACVFQLSSLQHRNVVTFALW